MRERAGEAQPAPGTPQCRHWSSPPRFEQILALVGEIRALLWQCLKENPKYPTFYNPKHHLHLLKASLPCQIWVLFTALQSIFWVTSWRRLQYFSQLPARRVRLSLSLKKTSFYKKDYSYWGFLQKPLFYFCSSNVCLQDKHRKKLRINDLQGFFFLSIPTGFPALHPLGFRSMTEQ